MMMILESQSDVVDRFLQHIESIPTAGCWIWIGAISNGYGWTGFEGKTEGAHRVSWKLFKGPIPEYTHVLHKCDIKCCVNPEHLHLGSNIDNIVDYHSRQGTGNSNSWKTECLRGHPFSGSNLMLRKDGTRICRACLQLRRRPYKHLEAT